MTKHDTKYTNLSPFLLHIHYSFYHKFPEDPEVVPGGFITDCNKVCCFISDFFMINIEGGGGDRREEKTDIQHIK